MDLAHSGLTRKLLLERWPQFLARAVTLAGFVFTILAGYLGSPVGSHNFAIIFVWIAWWTALKLLFIPLGGRAWCSICPLPMPGEWIQQGGLLVKGKGIGLNKPWPRALRNSWLQSAGFLLIGVFSAVTLTTTAVTALALLGLIGLALILSLVYEKRAFCSYVCPIGGFSGQYSRLAPVEVRVKDQAVCASHTEKTCYDACRWGLFPAALNTNTNCGLCLECLRACPEDNLAFNLRSFGKDLHTPKPARSDETFLALSMLGSAAAFTAVFLGPWGGLKMAAFAVGSAGWLVYTLGFLLAAGAGLPGLYLLSLLISRHATNGNDSLRALMARYTPALLPLGLATWIAFTAGFAFIKWELVLVVLADPFGWGWNLLAFNPASTWISSISLVVARLLPALEGIILAAGLGWAGSTALSSAKREQRPRAEALAPILFMAVYTLLMAFLLI